MCIRDRVIQQVQVPIADTDNVGIVHDKLMLLGYFVKSQIMVYY